MAAQLSFGGKSERIPRVPPRADDACENTSFIARELHGVKCEQLRRQSCNHDRAAGSKHSECRVISGLRGRGDKREMYATAGSKFSGDVLLGGIQRFLRAGFARQVKLRVVHIHRDNVRAHGASRLHSQMTEPADSKNRNELAGCESCVAQGAEHCDARAKKRRGLSGGKRIGNGDYMRGFRDHEFRVAAVHRNAGDRAILANILAAFAARQARAAAPENPTHTHARVQYFFLYARTGLDNAADDLVSRNQRALDEFGERGPISADQVKVGVANAAGFDPQQHFAFSRRGTRHVLHFKTLAEFVHDCGAQSFLSVLLSFANYSHTKLVKANTTQESPGAKIFIVCTRFACRPSPPFVCDMICTCACGFRFVGELSARLRRGRGKLNPVARNEASLHETAIFRKAASKPK